MADATDIKSKIETAVTSAVSDPKVRAQVSAIPSILAAIEPVVDQFLHSTNNEPWYRSRVTWGTIITFLGAVLMLFNIDFSADLQKQVLDLVMAAVPIVGGLVTLYGRWRATVPIGGTSPPADQNSAP